MTREQRIDLIIKSHCRLGHEHSMRIELLELSSEEHKRGYDEAFKQHANYREDMGR